MTPSTPREIAATNVKIFKDVFPVTGWSIYMFGYCIFEHLTAEDAIRLHDHLRDGIAQMLTDYAASLAAAAGKVVPK